LGQTETAVQRDAAVGALSPTFAPAGQALEPMPGLFAPVGNCEDLVWTELTYKGRTFEFNRGLHIRVTHEDGGCSFDSADPELFGFGHTRLEAEQVFCLDFASCWDDFAIEDDVKLTRDAIELKRALLALVKTQR